MGVYGVSGCEGGWIFTSTTRESPHISLPFVIDGCHVGAFRVYGDALYAGVCFWDLGRERKRVRKREKETVCMSVGMCVCVCERESVCVYTTIKGMTYYNIAALKCILLIISKG